MRYGCNLVMGAIRNASEDLSEVDYQDAIDASAECDNCQSQDNESYY